jgi:hypothetical protein
LVHRKVYRQRFEFKWRYAGFELVDNTFFHHRGHGGRDSHDGREDCTKAAGSEFRVTDSAAAVSVLFAEFTENDKDQARGGMP